MVLSVIIVNYNVKYFLEQCLLSIQKALQAVEGEIIVIDNNSEDGSRQYFAGRFDDVKFIWKNKNTGFSKACNEGLAQAAGDYILFLNPDTIVPEDCFEKCISFIRSKNNRCALGVKMVDGSGKFLKESKRSFPSPLISFYKLAGLASLFPRSPVFAKYYLGHLDRNQDHAVDVLAGAFMMIPSEIIYQTGSFDESFFMYGEDIDLSYRIQKSGFENFYYAGSRIIHFKGESTRKATFNYVKMFYKAMSIFAHKHYGGAKAGILNVFIQIAIFIAGLLSGLKNLMAKLGMKIMDAAVILLSFWIVKFLWNGLVKPNVDYSHNLLLIAFPAFTLLFWFTSYFSGLYDTGYRQTRLLKAIAASILVVLAAYSLLPESVRFSRGILLFGSLLAYLLMSLLRKWMVSWRIIEREIDNNELFESAVVGNKADFEKVKNFYSESGIHKRLAGRITFSDNTGENIIGKLGDINSLATSYGISELIYCAGSTPYANIIESVAGLPRRIRIKLFNPATNTIIQSEKNIGIGKIYAASNKFRISNSMERRKKRLVDILLAFFFIITFPVHLFTKKRVINFFKNTWQVLAGKRTWIGFATNHPDLPFLRNGILTSTGLPAHLNILSFQDLLHSDTIYAREYQALKDVQLLWFNYQLLS
ncbi:glycosyltransferase [soil metagenome]